MAGGSGITLGFMKYVLGLDGLAFEEGLGLAEKQLKASQKKLAKIGDRMKGAGQALSLAVTLPVVAFAGAALNVASDAGELQSAFDTTFGAMSKDMNEWARVTGDAMGRSTTEMQKAANTFGIFFNTAVPAAKAAEMSKTFSKLAQDLGSFFNVDTQTAIEKLRSGLSGESEPLRDFGVFLTEASVKAKALELGLTGVGNELTEQEKIVARYQLILEATGKAQGDVQRTSGSFANQVRASKAAFEELQVTIGTKLIPVLTPLVKKIAEMLNWFGGLSERTKMTALTIASIAAAAGPLAFAFGSITASVGTLLPLLSRLGGASGLLGLTGAAGPLALVAAGALAVYVAYQHWDKIGPWIDGVIERTSAAARDINARLAEIQAEATAFDKQMGIPAPTEFFSAIGKELQTGWERLERYGKAVQDWADRFDAGAVQVWKSFETMHARVQAAFNRMVGGIRDSINGGLRQSLQWVQDKAKAVGDAFYNLYDRVVGHSYVPDMVDGIADHMARLDSVMVAPAAKAAAAVSAKFKALAEELRPLMDRLFPEARAALDLKRDAAMIEAGRASGQLTPDAADAARSRLFTGTNLEAVAIPDFAGLAHVWQQVEEAVSKPIETAADRAATAFTDIARSALDGARNVVDAIKGGGLLDIMGSLLDAFTQLAGMGAFGSKLQTRVQANTNFGGFRAAGGPAVPGKSYVVGENGPEWFTPRAKGFVTPGANDNRSTVRIVPSPYFSAVVDGRAGKVVQRAAPVIAAGGSADARSREAFMQDRRLA
ncbi:phage tail tape measure protein [Sphingomonas sp.]|jgi:hypothetical protein|uniref:phage tail tape measure protein n=1 Tax=Sphingomonas sp. TaxID=28214 RepID=UPI002D80788A|nr:phage tail tape measure protein [Sphingomonas sp.]HEU0045076.1 phage tail tape measure protein [Sphingomonas sp.]